MWPLIEHKMCRRASLDAKHVKPGRWAPAAGDPTGSSSSATTFKLGFDRNNMKPSSFVSGSCWCNRVGGNFLAHCTVFYPPTDASLQQDVPQISHYLKLLSWKWKSVLCTQTVFRVIRFPSSRAPLGRGGAGDGVRHVWRSQVSVDQNVWGRFRL